MLVSLVQKKSFIKKICIYDWSPTLFDIINIFLINFISEEREYLQSNYGTLDVKPSIKKKVLKPYGMDIQREVESSDWSDGNLSEHMDLSVTKVNMTSHFSHFIQDSTSSHFFFCIHQWHLNSINAWNLNHSTKVWFL